MSFKWKQFFIIENFPSIKWLMMCMCVRSIYEKSISMNHMLKSYRFNKKRKKSMNTPKKIEKESGRNKKNLKPIKLAATKWKK